MEGFQALGGALLSVVVILIMAYWCSRYLGKRFGSVGAGRYLELLDRIQVGPDRYVLLLKLQGHTYLIGVSGAGVQLLSEPEDFIEEVDETLQEGGDSPSRFQELLKMYGSLREKKKGR